MYHRREQTTTARRTEDGTTEDSHVDFLNLIVDLRANNLPDYPASLGIIAAISAFYF